MPMTHVAVSQMHGGAFATRAGIVIPRFVLQSRKFFEGFNNPYHAGMQHSRVEWNQRDDPSQK